MFDLDTDLYFSNLEMALEQQKKKYHFTDELNNYRRQFCYCDLTDKITNEIIQVPQNIFVKFFSKNSLPIPYIVINDNGEINEIRKNNPKIIVDILTNRANLQIPQKLVDML